MEDDACALAAAAYPNVRSKGGEASAKDAAGQQRSMPDRGTIGDKGLELLLSTTQGS